MPRGEKRTGQVGVRLDPELMAAVEEEAAREDRPLGMMARILIREAIAARRGEPAKPAAKAPRKRP